MGYPPNPDPQDGETGVNIFGYTPWLAATVLGVAVFGALVIANVAYMCLQRNARLRTYQVLLLVACVFEIIGYGFRLKAHSNPFLLVPFVIQYFFIVVAPVFFSAAVYLSLSIIPRSVVETYGPMPSLFTPRRIFALFLTADVVTTVLQIAGAALVGVGYSRQADGEVPPLTPEQANSILLAGLCVQAASFVVFLIYLTILGLSLVAGIRHGKAPAPSDERITYEKGEPPTSESDDLRRPSSSKLLWLFGLLWLASVSLLLRIVFRVAESAAGTASDISTDQGLFFLEFIPVIISSIILTFLSSLLRMQ
ncbi:unnamed protein product [Sympodiomycopsis kandeliae]